MLNNNLWLGLAASVALGIGSVAAAGAQDADAGAEQPEAAEAVAELTIYDGVYTEEQDVRGTASYREQCSSCHGPTARGGSHAPGLTGHRLNNVYVDQPLFAYYERIHTTMPLGRPNSLPPQTYVDIIAHLLALHGAPAGDMELLADDELLQSIQIVAPPASE